MTDISISIKTNSYTKEAEKLSDLSGNHILAQYDEGLVILYQAVCPEIADFAVTNGYFGGPFLRFHEEMILKTSFLWTVGDSGWCTVPGKERILAITIEKRHFEAILETALTGTMYQTPPGQVISESVRLVWKPECNYSGASKIRNTLLIGIHGELLKKFNSRYIDAIQDITEFAQEQHNRILNDDLSSVIVPEEKQFVPGNKDVCRRIMLAGFYILPEKHTLQVIQELETVKLAHVNKPQTKAMLFYQGSFNPVHSNHVQALLECKQWLEKNTNYKILAAVMAVNCDDQLMVKFKGKRDLKIKSKHRLEMCKIATKSYRWIYTYERSVVPHYRKQILRDMENKHCRNVQWIEVFGADRAKTLVQCGFQCCTAIVGRQGETEKMKQAFDNAVRKGKIDADRVFIIPVTLENISSTCIRTGLKIMAYMSRKDDKVKALRDLVESGWLHGSIANYLVEHESDLYW